MKRRDFLQQTGFGLASGRRVRVWFCVRMRVRLRAVWMRTEAETIYFMTFSINLILDNKDRFEADGFTRHRTVLSIFDIVRKAEK